MNAFLRRYLEDREAGSVEPLKVYLDALPGHEEVVAQEYLRLQGGTPEGPGGDPGATLGGAAVHIPHERIGAYKLLSVLGEGGMGIVYLAEQTEPFRRRVALKLIKLGMDTRQVLGRFESERQALALMNHPYIARVHEAGTTADGRPFFVMEHVAGVPITEYSDRHHLTTRERLELFVQVCEGVQHAHQKGIIHRDLKPSNILVGIEGERPLPKIIDFGVAKSLNQRLTDRTLYTEQGQFVGTPAYMSPEQAELSALDVDTRADIYALGVLLYELMVGVLPFDAKTLREGGPLEVQRLLREEEPPRPSTRLSHLGRSSSAVARARSTEPRSLLRELRGDLDWIVMKALEKDRSRRYASASEFAMDVRRHLEGERVLARPPTLAYRLEKLLRRHRTAAAVTAVLLIGGTGITLGALHVAGAAYRRERSRESLRLVAAARSQRRDYAALKAEIQGLEEKWEEAQGSIEPWRPVWELEPLLEKGRALREARRRAEALYNRAVASFHAALQAAPEEGGRLQVVRDLESLYWDRYLESQRGEVVLEPDFFRTLAESTGAGTHRENHTLRIATAPPGAEVYCFRYELHEWRLFPVPYHPEWGPGGGPFLEVEAVRDSETSALRAGDRLLAAGGRSLRSQKDLVAALEGLARGQPLEVQVRRGGETVALEWVPFPAGGNGKSAKKEKPRAPGNVQDLRLDLGLTLAAYPLDFRPDFRLGATGGDGPLEVELPRGSYLLVLRIAGRPDVRYPVTIPREESDVRVSVLAAGAIPPGFLYVPAGPFTCGGDSRHSFQSLERGRRDLHGFFMGRYEVKAGEYLEFLNAPGVLPLIDEEGQMEPRAPLEDLPRAARDVIAMTRRRSPRVQVVPRDPHGRLYFERPEGEERWVPRVGTIDWPVLSVPMLAGLEYAHWLTERFGGRWRFRLPDDLEWEKAARGADERIFVWGNDPVWSYCRSGIGSLPPRRPGPAGVFPFDESVYGVRDLAGSVAEPTTSLTLEDFSYIALRGGDWNTPDAYRFRLATRDGRTPEARGTDAGLRLVADLPR